jgi:hypothetical protein
MRIGIAEAWAGRGAGSTALTSPSCEVRSRIDCTAGSLLGFTATAAGCGFAACAIRDVSKPLPTGCPVFQGEKRASRIGSCDFCAVGGIRKNGLHLISVPPALEVGAVVGSGLGGTGSSWNGSLAFGIGGPSGRTLLQQLGVVQQVGALLQVGLQLVVHDDVQQPPQREPQPMPQPAPHLPPNTHPCPKPQHTLHGSKQSSIRQAFSIKQSGAQ